MAEMVEIRHFRCLRQVVRMWAFSRDAMVRSTDWMIRKGEGNISWQLYYRTYKYDFVPIVACVKRSLKNICLSDADYKRICKIISEVYDITKGR